MQIHKTVATALLLAFASAASADQVLVGAWKDNSINEESGDLSNGAGDHFFAGNSGGSASRRGLVAFDLISAGIPSGSTVHSVTLQLHMSRTQSGDQTVSLHRVTSDWGEGTSHAGGEEGGGAAATDGDATWLYTFYDAAEPGSSPTWSNPGGDHFGAASAAQSVGGIGTYVWGSTASLVADVQTWVDNPASNFGWIVIGNEGPSVTSKRFNSRTFSNAAQRPLLTIDFTPPPAQGACCLPGEVCEFSDAVECATQGGSYEGDGTTCASNPCVAVPTGSCCTIGGACTEQTETACLAMPENVYQGDGTSCASNPCPQLGACCFDDATCQDMLETECSAGGGSFQGDGSVCLPDQCSIVLTPFLDPLPIPAPAQPVSGVVGEEATYQIAARQVTQQLHSQLPPTTVWAYGDGSIGATYPGPTIEASQNTPVTVEWINDLHDAQGDALTEHYLPVDLCPHGAEDLPKTVVHLHGAHVQPEYDGYPEDTYLPGVSATFVYPNEQPPGTLWYHDHALGITRLNVYMGLAGFYLIRDPEELALNLPAAEYEIPMVVQDRSFNPDGSWKYPAVWQDHFFGDKILVNGKVWPYLNVKRGKYRFRILNGSNSRTYTLALSPNTPLTLIGTDGGLLPAPMTLDELTLAPAERADVIVDFEGFVGGQEILMTNSAPAPFPGTPGVGVIPNVMKFIVADQPGFIDPAPDSLRPSETLQEADAVVTRDFVLRRTTDACTGTEWLINDMHWDHVMEFPRLGTTEIWRFVNQSGMMHPMHMHLVLFQVLDHQNFEVVDDEIVPVGSPIPPSPTESGWKDTVQVPPQQMTRVIARFEDYRGLFAYHCHILEHEDHEMMRQFFAVNLGDSEPDGDVDLTDYAALVDCLSGPGTTPVPSPPTAVQDCLDAFDGDYDGDVDLKDASDFNTGFTGSLECIVNVDCSDGLYCNGMESCVGGLCQPGVPVDCSAAADQCNTGTCDESLDVCVSIPLPDSTSCDDGLGCPGDKCVAGVCQSPVCTQIFKLLANGVFDNENGIDYFAGGPDGSAPMDDLRTLAEERNVPINSANPSFWWEARFEDLDTGVANDVRAQVHVRKETGLTGILHVEVYVGGVLRASQSVSADTILDDTTPQFVTQIIVPIPAIEGQPVSSVNDVSVRLYVTFGNGRTLFWTYSALTGSNLLGP